MQYSQMFKRFCFVYSNSTKVIPFRVIFLIILGKKRKPLKANSLKLNRTPLGRERVMGHRQTDKKTMETIVPKDGVFFFTRQCVDSFLPLGSLLSAK